MKTSICFQCKGQALCPTGKVQPREATVSVITGCSRFQSKDKQTHADQLRAMTDEELDKFLGEVQWDVANYCGGVTKKQEYPVPEQVGAWLDWLKLEVSDADN